MIWLGLRLGLLGRRSAQVSAAVLVVTIALGLGASLISLGYAGAVGKRADRSAWTDLSRAEILGISSERLPAVTYTDVTQDYYHRLPVTVVSLAPSDDGAPMPPGVEALPEPGQVLVSPALRDLMGSSHALADRYGDVTGTLGGAGLASPTSLLALRRVPLQEAMLSGSAVSAFGMSAAPVPLQDVARLLPAIMLLAVLALTAVLAVIATRIGGTERRDRLGRLRLLGASTRQVRLIAVLERTVPIAVGLASGVGAFRLLRDPAADVVIGDGTFFPEDMTPGPATMLTALLLVGALGLVSTQAEVRRIVADPVAVVRAAEARVRPGPRLVPALVLLALIGWLGVPAVSPWQAGRTITVLSSTLAAFGVLLLVGPWLVQLVGAYLRRSGGPVRLLSGRRLQSGPRGVFRSTAGIAVAIVMTTAYAAVAPSAYAELSDDRVIGQQHGTVQINVSDASTSEAGALLERLTGLRGVEDVAAVSTAMTSWGGGSGVVWIGDCTALVAAARLRDVPCGQAPVIVSRNRLAEGLDPRQPFELYDFRSGDTVGRNNETLSAESGARSVRYPAMAVMPGNTAVDSPDVIIDSSVPGTVPAGLRASTLLVRHTRELDMETLRTIAFQAAPNVQVATRDTSFDGFNLELRTVRDLVQILSMTLFVLAGVSVLVAANASLVERRDAFRALLEAGAPRSVLLWGLATESTVPVLLTGGTAALTGGVAAWLLVGNGLPLMPVVVNVVEGVALTGLLSLAVLLPARRLTRAA